MKYTGTTYRPPFEADSLLLQVTAGCSHNKCTFCSMYRDIPFAMETMEQIETDLLEARANFRHIPRIYLVNADPFTLSAKRLKAIAVKINEIIPEVQSIGMYASIQNIKGKTDAELKELRALKINDLNIGVESGLPEVVQELNKGFTVDEARQQLARLNAAGIEFSLNIIIGAAGSDRLREHAIASAKLVNEVNPRLVFVATMHLEDESPLRADLLSGTFKENTLGQNIEEELLFLRELDVEGTRFFGLHPSNTVRVGGILPQDKERMVSMLEQGLATIDSKYLGTANTKLVKGNEGAVLLKG